LKIDKFLCAEYVLTSTNGKLSAWG